MLRMKLGCLPRMVSCLLQVPLRRVSVMSRLLVVASFVMARCFMMMPGGMLMVLCCFAMVFCGFLGHKLLLADDLRPQGRLPCCC